MDTAKKQAEEELSLKLIFKKPYTFEGKEYAEVDLSELENWTGGDIDKAKKALKVMDGLDPRRVFPSGDHRALAAVMASVLDAGTSPAERSRGRELVERVYNWDRDGENLVRLLETTGRK
jgi:hypothetical protein